MGRAKVLQIQCGEVTTAGLMGMALAWSLVVSAASLPGRNSLTAIKNI
jgi:hypothetical protein